MRTLLILLCALVTGPIVHAKSEYSKNVRYAIKQLSIYNGIRGKPEVGGSAVGYAGEPHPTYILQEYIKRMGEFSDFKKMLEDESAIVRVMGAYCIISSDQYLFLEKEVNESIDEVIDFEGFRARELAQRKEFLVQYKDDSEEIDVGPGGCGFGVATVGSVIAAMIENPTFFEFGTEPVAGGDATR